MKTFNDLMQNALKIEGPTEICWPTSDRIRETINPSDYRFYDQCYSVGTDVIAFIYGKTLYVMPYYINAEKILTHADFKKKHFYVPLSGGAYPIDKQNEWEEIKEKAEKIEDYTKKCVKYAEKRGYGSIDEGILEEYCFEIPVEGVEVERIDGSRFTHYPAIRYIKNNSILGKIGLYSIRNGICAFVYRDGKTYVTCHDFIIEELHKKGYRNGFLWIPFSDGNEKIIDLKYSIKWEKILRL